MKVLVTLPKNRANPLILYHLKLEQNHKAEKVGASADKETWRLYLHNSDFVLLPDKLPRMIQARTEVKFETVAEYKEKKRLELIAIEEYRKKKAEIKAQRIAHHKMVRAMAWRRKKNKRKNEQTGEIKKGI